MRSVVVGLPEMCYRTPMMPEPGSQDEFVVDDEPQAPQEPPRDDLDGVRIRRIAELRRSAYRSGSYCIVGAVACGVMAVQLVWLILRNLQQGGWRWIESGYLLLTGVAIGLGIRLWRRSRQLRREANQTQLQEPVAPPDFTPLHNGGEPWKNLDQVQ
ncbi:MAG: hypothetical protein ACM359_08085 [Bacillota bacterium]